MFRLMIVCDDPACWQTVETRLADVAIETSSDWTSRFATFDAVVIAKPITDASSPIDELLRAGKHVLCAGDIDLSWQDLTALQATSRRAQVQFAIANPDRFLPSRQLIKQQIPDKIGLAGLVRIHRWEPSTGSAGSLLRDIDLALWLVGTAPDQVFAVENHIADNRIVQAHLSFPGGGMALIDHTSGLPNGDGYQAVSVIGASGAAYADDHQNTQLLYRGGRPQAVRTVEGIRQAIDMVQWFTNALKDGRDLSENLAEWQRVFAVHKAITESLATKCS